MEVPTDPEGGHGATRRSYPTACRHAVTRFPLLAPSFCSVPKRSQLRWDWLLVGEIAARHHKVTEIDFHPKWFLCLTCCARTLVALGQPLRRNGIVQYATSDHRFDRAAVHPDRRPAHVVRIGAHQVRDRAGDLVGAAEPPDVIRHEIP